MQINHPCKTATVRAVWKSVKWSERNEGKTTILHTVRSLKSGSRSKSTTVKKQKVQTWKNEKTVGDTVPLGQPQLLSLAQIKWPDFLAITENKALHIFIKISEDLHTVYKTASWKSWSYMPSCCLTLTYYK